MSGNQYFIVILVAILAYFLVSTIELYVRNKEASNQARRTIQLNQEQVRIHMENMELIKTIKELANDKS